MLDRLRCNCMQHMKLEQLTANNEMDLPPVLPPPLIPQPVIYQPRCPVCSAPALIRGSRRFTTGGVISLTVGLLLAPVLIGIIFIVAAFSMRRAETHCTNCKQTFNFS